MPGKVFLSQSHKEFTNIIFHVHTTKKVEPNYLPLSVSFFFFGGGGLSDNFYIFIESASLRAVL